MMEARCKMINGGEFGWLTLILNGFDFPSPTTLRCLYPVFQFLLNIPLESLIHCGDPLGGESVPLLGAEIETHDQRQVYQSQWL